MSPSRLPLFEYAQVLPLGFQFPARMSVLPLAEGQVALVSPIPIDAARAASIAELGRVAFLIAPNLLHHLYLEAAMRRYPEARVLGPSRLAAKKPGLRIDVALDVHLDTDIDIDIDIDAAREPAKRGRTTLEAAVPPELAAAVDVLPIRGVPGLDEFVFYHRATRTLVVTDLVFHITRPRGWLAHLTLFLVGCHRRLGSSRALRMLVKDRAAARASVERILDLPFETLVMAHGDVIEHDARARLERALAWLAPAPKAFSVAASGTPR